MKTTQPTKNEQKRVIPEGATEQRYPEAKVVVYRHTGKSGLPCFMGFAGNTSKPSYWRSFNTTERMESFIDAWVTEKTEREQRKTARKTQDHGLVVGDIVCTTWGWEQTNVSFFQVVKVPTAKSVVIREIKGKREEEGQSMSGISWPVKDAFLNEKEVMKRAQGTHVVSGFDYCGWLKKWEGQPVSISWYA